MTSSTSVSLKIVVLVVTRKPRARAVLIASILHYGQHTVPEIKAHLAREGVPIRPAD